MIQGTEQLSTGTPTRNTYVCAQGRLCLTLYKITKSTVTIWLRLDNAIQTSATQTDDRPYATLGEKTVDKAGYLSNAADFWFTDGNALPCDDFRLQRQEADLRKKENVAAHSAAIRSHTFVWKDAAFFANSWTEWQWNILSIHITAKHAFNKFVTRVRKSFGKASREIKQQNNTS